MIKIFCQLFVLVNSKSISSISHHIIKNKKSHYLINFSSCINTLQQQISMAKNLKFHNIYSCLHIFYQIFHFSTLFTCAASYVVPNHYFINCGSSFAVAAYNGRRNFTADEFFSGDTTQAQDEKYNFTSSQDDDRSLYGSARVFLKASHYEFYLTGGGIYVVRLHFFPFKYAMGDLHNATFSVTASGFAFLSNLDFVSKDDGNLPRIEEFLIKRDTGKLKIKFRIQTFAFINAIEVFLAPPDFIVHSPPLVTQHGAWNLPLRVVHRINVGGEIVTRATDNLFRTWIPDDPYLHLKMAINTTYNGKIEYQSEGSTIFDAPQSVYNTAKEMNIDENGLADFNLTWQFEVEMSALHLLRLHFCDIVSSTSNEEFTFNLYTYASLREEVSPLKKIQRLAAPFYFDVVVLSDNSGFLNISIGPNQDSPVKTAFLNGVEIMEMIQEHGSSILARKRVFKVVCWVLGVGILVAMILSILIICLRKRECRTVEEVSEWAFVHIRGGSLHSKISKTSRSTARTVTGSVHTDLNLGLKIPLSAIIFATRKFSPKMIIGEGGFGKVYKGKMRDGRKIAVKRSESGHGQGLQEFHREITVLSKICHQHLVSLIGYCDEKNEMILVYEFMEYGSLRDHLYGSKGTANSTRFSWEQRLKICIGAARGLHYLHTGCSWTIVHRDIKSTNILLDENYVAKVSDFGLSVKGSLEQTHFSTEVKGSFGYLDPEYYSTLQLTQKSDVYSFGVVLLEVLCARKPVDPSLSKEEASLADWGLSWQKKGQLECIIDPFLVGKIDQNSLRIFGETMERCLKDSGSDRPYMSDVLRGLEYCLQFQNPRFCRQLCEGSSMDTSLGLPTTVVRRLPSDSVSISEEEVAFRCM